MKKGLIILFAGIFAACSDFLEPKSQSEYIPREASALNEMLLGNAYPGAYDGAEIMDLLPVLDDDVMCTDSLGEIDQLMNGQRYKGLRALFSWQPDVFVTLVNTSTFTNSWENYYAYILGTNAALDYIDNVSGTDDEKNLVKGQAYALRAYYYFQLVNMWGEPYNYNKDALGVPLKTVSGLEYKELPRNTVKEVYTRVMDDLDEAEKLYASLPASLQFKKDYRTNLPMVQLLKSRVYLYMEDWKNAAIYAKKVIDEWDFLLMNLNTLPEKTTRNPYYNFVSEDCSESIWLFGKIDKFTTYLTYYLNVEDPWDSSSSMYIKFLNASSSLLDLYVEGDLRKDNYIARSMYTDSEGDRYIGGYMPYGKFALSSTYTPETGEKFAHAFRLAEAYLNLAEAAAKDNDTETALWALNTLRENRFTSETFEEVSGISGEQLVERIRLERRLELCFEGHRWFDLRRYGMPSLTHVWKENGNAVQTYTLAEKDPFYTLPIPQQILDKNRNLVQNKLPNAR